MHLVVFTEPGEVERWQPINDEVMGGRSNSQLTLLTAGTALFHGVVSLAAGGGFASVRRQDQVYDLSDAGGVKLRCRGDGHLYKFNLRLEKCFDGVVWQAPFDPVPSEWETINLPFSAFVPTYHGHQVARPPEFDPARILSFGLVIGGRQDGPFHLELEWVKSLDPNDAA